ncbi:hypothetical protein [Pseudophaeobacter sp.]|jgi:hypothetical protein|uniref:DUF6950 family protein n=1 Tax=Pseudophaeobacter sp. TaxID=1971739 RepID=UPI0032645C78
MTPLVRFPDWQVRLAAYIYKVRSRPFRPSSHDCALFGAGAVLAQTGVDLSVGWTGYRSLDEGLGRLQDAGFDDHISLVESLLPERSPLGARVGDIAILDAEMGQSVGVVQGASVYVIGRGGLGTVPLSQAKRAFLV